MSYLSVRRHVDGTRARAVVLVGVVMIRVGLAAGVHAQAPSAPRNVRLVTSTGAPTVTVGVSPENPTLSPGSTQQFVATVTGTGGGVVWTATGGSISQTGLYTAGQTPGNFSVKATLSGGTLAAFGWVKIISGPTYIDINPGEDIQGKVNAAASGSAFRLKAGVHRLSGRITPKDGNTFLGESGAIVSGARLLTSFTRSGNYWVASGQTQQGPIHGDCQVGYPRCSYPEDLYIDDRLLRHVGTLAEVAAGKWYFDYANDRIYFYDDPTGRRVETTVIETAFGGAAANVTISSLVIEKFANRAQLAALDGDSSRAWTVQDSEMRFNHGVGLRVGHGMKVLRSKIHHNGQMGAGGVGDDVLVQDSEFGYNNVAGYDYGWEGGGTKFVKTNRLILRNNYAHHNNGPGLWLDIDNINFTVEGNTSEDNFSTKDAASPGIFVEISYGGIVRNNKVRRNGAGFSGWIWNAGILVAASGGTGLEIVGNTVEDNEHGISLIQQARGSGAHGPYLVQNVYVHDNVVRMPKGQTGVVQDIADNAVFSRNNRFEHNTYYLSPGGRFAWMNADRSDVEWKGYGLDTTGTFIR